MCLINRLVALGKIEQEEIGNSNQLNHYLPIRSKKNAIHYDTVAGNVLGLLIGQKLHNFDPAAFEKSCLTALKNKLTNNENFESLQKHLFSKRYTIKGLTRVFIDWTSGNRVESQRPFKRHISPLSGSAASTI